MFASGTEVKGLFTSKDGNKNSIIRKSISKNDVRTYNSNR